MKVTKRASIEYTIDLTESERFALRVKRSSRTKGVKVDRIQITHKRRPDGGLVETHAGYIWFSGRRLLTTGEVTVPDNHLLRGDHLTRPEIAEQIPALAAEALKLYLQTPEEWQYIAEQEAQA